jgi:hypothetical protein
MARIVQRGTVGKSPSKERNVSKNKNTTDSPVDNITYDIITVIHEKAKGLEAFDQYIEDAAEDEDLVDLLETIREQDEQCIEELKPHLVRLLQQNAGESPIAASAEAESRDEESQEERKQPDTAHSGSSRPGKRKAS